MSKWLNELCPIILDMLQDASLIAKREVLPTLYMLTSQKKYVMYHHTKELDEIQDSLKTI